MNGGYQIISLGNLDFSEDGTSTYTIEGIHQSIEESLKAILLTGIVIGGVELHDTFVSVTGGSPYVMSIGNTYQVTINTDDSVNIKKI